MLDISIPNSLKQCSPFPFQMVWNNAVYFHFISILSISILNVLQTNTHFIYCHSKCLNKHSFHLFGMVKTILAIPNGQKCAFQTGLRYLFIYSHIYIFSRRSMLIIISLWITNLHRSRCNLERKGRTSYRQRESCHVSRRPRTRQRDFFACLSKSHLYLHE